MKLLDLIEAAIQEDLPNGDVTTDSLGMRPKAGTAKLLAKQDLILSGATVFEAVLQKLEPAAQFKWYFKDGDRVLAGQTVCLVDGDLLSILKAERVALNFVMHLSGVATFTREFVDQVRHTKTKILDTRKTLPGYRSLEKAAVLHGGGVNHRMNLSDAILIKDNHIKVAGGLTQAVERVRSRSLLPIEVETRSLEEVREAIPLRPFRILLDNMNTSTLKECVQLIPSDIQTEASGNMSLLRVKEVAETGVNYISVGALTHSAPSADLSLKFDWDLR